MNTPRQPRPEPPRMRRSTKVALVLLGATGVVGGIVAFDAWQRSRENDAAANTSPPAPPVSGEQAYTNNAFIPGVGYYHAPFFGWYPFPYNFRDPTRGYFSGGLWRPSPFASDVLQSHPSSAAVAAALAAQRAQQVQQQQRARSSNFFGGGSGSSRFFSGSSGASGSSGSTSGSHSSVQRGGFGSSSHGSGGGSS